MSSELKAFAAALLFAAASLTAQTPAPQASEPAAPATGSMTVYFVEEKPTVPPAPAKLEASDATVTATVALIFLLGGLVWLGLRPALCPKCGSKLSRLERTAEDAALLGTAGPARPVLVCLACGEVARRVFRAWVTADRQCRHCGRPTKKAALTTLEKSGYLTWGTARLDEDCLSCNTRSSELYPTPPLEAPAGKRLPRPR